MCCDLMFISEKFSIFAFGLLKVFIKNHGIQNITGRAEMRKEWVRAEKERMKMYREAQWLARVRGVGLVHKGRFFVW